MEHKLATAEKKVLVQLVKLVQKRKLAGENGEWKDFLNVYDKRNGASLSDPGRRSNDVLIAFLNTFKKKEHLQLLARVMQCDVNRDLIEKFKEESPDKETPEQRLVRKTIMHPEFATDYAFPSYSEDWLVTEIGKKKSMLKCTRMFAIDCEMVTCEDGTEAVVRVAVVDRDFEPVLHKYVKPDKPVIDYKTDITGVTAEDLERATLSVADIQKKLRRFLSKGTILVGHSLNKDLAVLKIDHARVIDTSLVFKFSGVSDSKRPSLNSLCKSVLGFELRKDNVVHDCVQDAAAAMRLVLAVVEKGAETLVPLPNEMLEAEKKRLETEKIKLLLHKIPSYVPSEELHSVITGDFTVDVKPAKKEGGFYSAVATFNSREEANRAFEKVDGDVVKDRSGLPQKLAEFTISSGTGASLYVRKMVQDSTTTKRARPEEDKDEEEEETNNARSKRQKREEELENRCEELSKEIEELKEKLKAKVEDDRAKEIEELKKKLNAKDFQIQAQDKMITNLKKKLEMKKKK